MHIKAITTTGGAVLGERPLDSDSIVLPTMLSAYGGGGTMVLYGSAPVREAREWVKLPVLGYWGYDFIRELAEARLAGAAYIFACEGAQAAARMRDTDEQHTPYAFNVLANSRTLRNQSVRFIC